MLLQTEGELHIAAGTTFSVSVVPLMEDDVERAEKIFIFQCSKLASVVEHESRSWGSGTAGLAMEDKCAKLGFENSRQA